MARSKDNRFRNGIQACRLAAGYRSSAELSNRLSVPKNTIDGWEQGRSFPRPEQVVELANLLGVSIDDLYGHQSTQKQSQVNGIADVAKRSDLKYIERIYDSSVLTGDRGLLMSFVRLLAGDFESLDAESLLAIATRTNAAMGVVLGRRRGSPREDGSSPEISHGEGKKRAVDG